MTKGTVIDLGPTPERWRGRRVLVTGHTGFKGAWLSHWLLRLGAEVTGLALPPETSPALFTDLGLAGRLAHHEVDLRDRQGVAAVVAAARPQVVFHLAAQSLVGEGFRDPVGTFATNVQGTVHLLDALTRGPAEVAAALRAVVIVTTDKCYAPTGKPEGYTEADRLGGHDPYAASKAMAELLVEAWRHSFLSGLPRCGLATARAGNVIGGGDQAAERLLPDCVRAFAEGREVVLRRPEATRPWQHVLDPLRGYLYLAEGLCRHPAAFSSAWNLGPDPAEVWSVQQVVARIADAWPGPARWTRVPAAPFPEAGVLVLDSEKAHQGLGWRPAATAGPAVDATVAWYLGQLAGQSAVSLCDADLDGPLGAGA